MKSNVFLCILLSTYSIASYVTPDMGRSMKKPSKSTLGVAWAKRNTIALTYETQSSDTEKNNSKYSESDIYGFLPFFSIYNSNFSGEIILKNEIQTYKVVDNLSTEDTEKSLDSKFAYRLNESAAIVASYVNTKTKEEGDEEETRKLLSFGLSFKNQSNFYFAGMYTFGNYGTDLVAVDYSKLHAGFGYEEWSAKDGYSVELLIEAKGKKQQTNSMGTVSTGSSTSLILNNLYGSGPFEISSDLEFFTGENYAQTSKTDSFFFDLRVEYLINPNIYTAPAISWYKTTTENTTTTSLDKDGTTFGLEVGYRDESIDTSFAIYKGARDLAYKDSTNYDSSVTAVTANLAYLF